MGDATGNTAALSRRKLGLAFAAALTGVEAAVAAQTESQAVFSAGEAQARLNRHLNRQVSAALERRSAAYDLLKTPEQIERWKADRRKVIADALGPMPEKTPLRARGSGTEVRDGYRIEKVLFESRPGFHVSAALYLPATKGPYPGVLVPCGHSENGKAAETYQRASQLLARNGLAALCYDPIGQGERKQVLGPDGKGRLGPTAEHDFDSGSADLVGWGVANHFVWDGVRALDYLLTRPDILPDKIGCTGNSGGGTQTAYLMAWDERIQVAAPSCYLTSFRRLLETIGPQDAEQDFFGALPGGLDHADFAILRAPKPTLMCVATRDFFDIQGAWDTFRQAKRIYARLGHPERMELAEADEQHGFTAPLRTAAVRWLRRWLLERDEPIVETLLPIEPDEKLQCTPSGQVLRLPGERTVFDIHRERAASLARTRRDLWIRSDAGAGRVRELLALPAAGELRSAPATLHAVRRIPGLTTASLTLQVASDLELPGQLRTYPRVRPTAVLMLRDTTASEENAVELARLLKEGHPVLVLDLPGLGEFKAAVRGLPLAGSAAVLERTTYLLGKPLVGVRTECILRAALLLREGIPGILAPSTGVTVHGYGEAVIPALHAAALHPNWIDGLRVSQAPRSWSDVLKDAEPALKRAEIVRGALGVYDLPDLAGRLARPMQVLK